MLTARMRTASGWSDACILNVSSRGLLVHSARIPDSGSLVELRHQDCAIVARVVWREGAKGGLRADGRVPVEEILSLGASASLTLSAPRDAFVERRRRPRTHEASRIRGRLMEFAGAVAIGGVLATGGAAMVQNAFAKPIAIVEAALGGQATAPADAR